MEHLALEVFDRTGNGSKFAFLPENTAIHIRRTSQVFGSGTIFTQDFQLNIPANAHIFGTSGEIHGSRLHEQINKRKVRIWAEGLPLFLGYLRLADEVEVDGNGNVDVTFEGGQKTFEDMIEGTKAREVSVGDVVIGVALNRKRVSNINLKSVSFTLDGLEAFVPKYPQIETAYRNTKYAVNEITGQTPYTQQWPKLVKSCGEFLDSKGNPFTKDYTNVQTPYDAAHPFCNINICYPFKELNESGEEKSGRGYTMRLAHSGKGTTDGGNNQTRFNNAPNFYLLHFIARLFKDLGIYVEENEMENIEDLRRVFMLNFGCHYEEIECANTGTENYLDTTDHLTPSLLLSRYGQYYIQIISDNDQDSLVKGWDGAGQYTFGEAKGLDHPGKVLLRNFKATLNGSTYLELGSVEGFVQGVAQQPGYALKRVLSLDKTTLEKDDGNGNGFYSAYLAYATGDNYPNVEINEIINAVKSMFGVRLLFSEDYKRVRIVLLRNLFRSSEVQEIDCEIVDDDVKVENSIRGFRMTYGKGKDDTNYYYKGFNDLFPRASKTWKDTTDKHDYSQWETNAEYDRIKQSVSPSNKRCYITPVNGNAYGVKVDEDEDVLFPSLIEYAGYMDAEDGDCSGEKETIEEIQCGASPVIMNEVNNAYAVLFSGDLSAPSPDIDAENIDASWKKNKWRSTYVRVAENKPFEIPVGGGALVIQGSLDVYLSEGFRIRLLDNYSVGNGGTPFDEADPGLCFGIMRSSGSDAYVSYDRDEIENESPMNDYWEVVPGTGAIDHSDTCDSYGQEWDYNGEERITKATAQSKLYEMFPNRNAYFYVADRGYVIDATRRDVTDGHGVKHSVLMAYKYSEEQAHPSWYSDYTKWLTKKLKESTTGGNIEEVYSLDRGGNGTLSNVIIEVDTTPERSSTMLALCALAYANGPDVRMDNGVGSRYGRFSLKLRAEKPNPFYNASQPESESNRRYLKIDNENLCGRGLSDQFYKDFSKFIREARIVKRTVRMELAQLLTIDDTVRVTVGDVTGFVKEMEYVIDIQTGLGVVTMDIMYI
ncbi:MAG: hypothetical protein IJ551_09325 [Prevotella sp.]|nr:hypothetical protein [Prevotella sp.]